MGTYRTKVGVVELVEAFQMTRKCYSDKSKWPKWLRAAEDISPEKMGFLIENFPSKELLIKTNPDIGFLSGFTGIVIGSWVVQNTKGEVYPCEASIFEAEYEPVGIHPAE